MALYMRKTRKLRMFVLDLLFPNRCPCCHKLIPWNAYLCDLCATSIALPKETFCPKCGKPWDSCFCGSDLAYDCAYVITHYLDYARSGILAMKKAESLQFGWYCADQFAHRYWDDPVLQRFDMIVPVPMAKAKLRVRGCNPAQVLAKELSQYINVPLREDLLWNDGSGRLQHLLSAKERHENVMQFQIKPADLTGLRILLCDDVLTTGATLSRCATLLKEQGAEEVAVFAATTSILQKNPPQTPIERKDT